MEKNESIGRLISSINRNIYIYIDAELKEYRIGSGQLPFLKALKKEDGINQETLTAESGVNKATTARAIGKLVQEGYAIRTRDEADNRAYKIHLTMKGLEIQPKLESISQRLTEVLTTGLTETEKKSVIKLLETIFQNILAENKKTG